MRFRATLPDGDVLSGELSLPPISIGRGLRPLPGATGRAIAEAIQPLVAEALAPHLPAAAPARKTVERDGDRIVGTIEHPATPPPSIRARQIAAELVPGIGAHYAAAIRETYRAIDARPVGPKPKAPAPSPPAVSPRAQAAAQAQVAAQAAVGAMTQAVLDKARAMVARLDRLEQAPAPEVQR